MSYIKAEEILPEELIRQIQEYADGVYIYIPRKPGARHPWGQKTEYKAVEYPSTAELMAELHELEMEIAKGLAELEEML